MSDGPARPALELERQEDIAYWWEGGFPGAFAADWVGTQAVEPKLRAAFTRVLLAMPEEDFERFLTLRPTVVCQPAVNGTAYSYHIPVWPKGADTMVLRVLYFRPDIYRLSDERLIRLVAHEVAHLLLGHADTGGFTRGAGDMHGEEAAERKAETWGFKGAYSREHRRRFARRHEASKQDEEKKQ